MELLFTILIIMIIAIPFLKIAVLFKKRKRRKEAEEDRKAIRKELEELRRLQENRK